MAWSFSWRSGPGIVLNMKPRLGCAFPWYELTKLFSFLLPSHLVLVAWRPVMRCESLCWKCIASKGNGCPDGRHHSHCGWCTSSWRRMDSVEQTGLAVHGSTNWLSLRNFKTIVWWSSIWVLFLPYVQMDGGHAKRIPKTTLKSLKHITFVTIFLVGFSKSRKRN